MTTENSTVQILRDALTGLLDAFPAVIHTQAILDALKQADAALAAPILPVAPGCGLCGCVGLHACPGLPMKPWTPEKIAELDRVLSQYKTEGKAILPVAGEGELRALLDQHDHSNPKAGHCHQCGLPMIANPHPDAGKPGHYLEVGCSTECLPCTVRSRHSWAGRCQKAESDLRAAIAQRAPVEAKPVATVIKKGADRQWMSEALGSLPDGMYSLYTGPVAPVEAPGGAVADPMSWPLPCDVKVGSGTIKAGCPLRTLVARMNVMNDMIREGWSSAKPAPAPVSDTEACQRNCPIDTPYGPATCGKCLGVDEPVTAPVASEPAPCRMQGGICACRSGGSSGGCAIEASERPPGRPAATSESNQALTGGLTTPGQQLTTGAITGEAEHAKRAEGERELLDDALSTTLWLHRRLPRTYGLPTFVRATITALGAATGVEVGEYLDGDHEAQQAGGDALDLLTELHGVLLGAWQRGTLPADIVSSELSRRCDAAIAARAASDTQGGA